MEIGCATPYLNSTGNFALGVLDEANVGGVLAEAATAQVETVLADDTVGVVAHAAARGKQHGSAPQECMRLCTLLVTLTSSVPQLRSLPRCLAPNPVPNSDPATAHPLGPASGLKARARLPPS